MKKAMMSALAGLVVTTGAAAAQPKPVAIIGTGGFSCGRYLELRAGKSEVQNAIMVSWIYGYFSGTNVASERSAITNMPDQAAILAYVDQHCAGRPLDLVLSAAIAMGKDLSSR